MRGFDADLVELRNHNALITDSLICFPADRTAGGPLIKELIQRSDVINVLASLSNLIDPLPAEHEDDSAELASDPPRKNINQVFGETKRRNADYEMRNVNWRVFQARIPQTAIRIPYFRP